MAEDNSNFNQPDEQINSKNEVTPNNSLSRENVHSENQNNFAQTHYNESQSGRGEFTHPHNTQSEYKSESHYNEDYFNQSYNKSEERFQEPLYINGHKDVFLQQSFAEPLHPQEYAYPHHEPVPDRSRFQDEFTPPPQMSLYTPDGIETHYIPNPSILNQGNEISNLNSNADIWNSISENIQDANTPYTVSPAFETQMRFNMQMSRIEYTENRDTPEAIHFARQYQEQRNAYMEYMSAVRNGRIQVEEPIQTSYNPEPNHHDIDSPNNDIACFYSPEGLTGVSIKNGHASSGVYTYSNPEYRQTPIFTPDNPLRVTPEYEQRMLDRMNQATSVLSQAPQQAPYGSQHQINKNHAAEIKYTTDAYLGFQRAKKEGLVVVSPDAALNIPDFDEWQQRQQHHQWVSRHNEPIIGSSQTNWRINPNQIKTANIEEINADLFNHNNLLKNKSVSSYYLMTLGNRLENHSINITSGLSRGMYGVMQSGEDNPIRTLESVRYYTTTAVALGSAIAHAAPVTRAANSAETLAKQEFRMFGNLTELSNKDLSVNISEHRKLAKANKAQIKDLYSKHHELNVEIGILREKGSLRTAEESTKLSRLLEMKEKTRNEIVFMSQAHANNSMQLRKEIGLQKRRHHDELQVKLAQDLKAEHPGNVTWKHVQNKMSQVQKEANAQMQKNFSDPIKINDKTIKLYQVTDKSLKKEIASLTTQTKDIKSKIQLLQSKGSSLTAAERIQLSKLLKKHEELSGTLRRYHGLRLERAALKEKLDAYSSLSQRLSKNINARRSTYQLLRNFIFKPIEEGSEIGAQGLSRGFSIATNRHVRMLVKKSIKLSYLGGRAAANIILPGSVQTIDASVFATKQVIKANVNVAVSTTKSAIKTGVKSTAHLGKRAIVRATPQRIRTAVSTSYSSTISVKNRFTALLNRGQKWFSDTTLGRGLATARRALNSASEAIRVASVFLKSLAVKVTAVFLVIFLLVGLVSICATNFTTGSASTVILSPYETDDGKFSLIPYVKILEAKEKAFYLEFLNNETKKEYEDIIIESRTNSLSNFREIISMTAVYCSQDLNLSTNPKVKKYLESLYDDSHYYTQKVEFFKCAAEDCETKECEGRDCQTKFCAGEDCEYKIVLRPCNKDCPEDCDGKHKFKVWYCPGDHPYCPGDHPYCPGEHKRLKVYVSALDFDAIFGADSMGNSGYTAASGSKIGNFTISYYCGENYPHICNDGTADTTATGTKPKANHTIAVDPDVIPLGSHVIIDGREYVAEDTGGAIQSNRIDIFVKTHQEALNKGMRYGVPVYWPSYEGEGVQESGEWNGWTDDNIEWAKALYSTNWSDLYDVALGGDLLVVGDFVWPLSDPYRVTCTFGPRVHPINGGYDFHSAVDLGVAVGCNVYAATDGIVTDAAYNSGSGNYVKLQYVDEDGTVIDTSYLHNSQLFVKKGEKVKAGDVIALSGNTGWSTGPHLHFAFIVNGEPQDPLRIYEMNNIEIE